MEERCEFLKPQETQIQVAELSDEEKILSSETFKNLDESVKETLIKNISGIKDYLKYYSVSVDEWIKDFEKAQEFIKYGLNNSNFKILKDKISSNLIPFMHLQREFKRFNFQEITFEDVLSLTYSESEFNPNAVSETWSVWLLQTTTNVVKDIEGRPKLYDKEIVKELASRNGVNSLTELSTEARSKFDNSIVLWLLYLKQLENRWNIYKTDVKNIVDEKDHFYTLVSMYLSEKWVKISKNEFEEVVNSLKKQKDLKLDYALFRDYNWQLNKYDWEKYPHRVYYAISIISMAHLMKKG